MSRANDFISRFGLRLPVVQGPFGGGLSTVRLAATVASGGGLGSYGAHHLEPDEIARVGREIRAQANGGPFALNLWVSSEDEGAADVTREAFEAAVRELQPLFDQLGVAAPDFPPPVTTRFADQVEALLAVRPPVFSFVFGVPDRKILEACRTRGIATVGAATTVEEACALEAAGLDAIVASGCEAGGHRPAFLRPAESGLVGTLALVPQVVDRVKVPVIAAGGIADARGVAAARALGASCAQIGTAFLACEESGAEPAHRDALFSDRARHTLLSRGFTGRLARFIRNAHLERYERAELDALPYPVQGWLARPIKQAAATRRDVEHMSLYAGQAAPLLKFRRAAELLDALASG